MAETKQTNKFKAVWELINKRGISVLPTSDDEVMDVTVSLHKKGDNTLPSCITFSRPATTGILAFLPDAEWQALKNGTWVE